MTDYTVSCHILNSNKGLPLSDILCELYLITDTGNTKVAQQKTNKDGRVPKDSWEYIVDHKITHSNTYMIRFQIKSSYYDLINEDTLYPYIDIPFMIKESSVHHYHIPLLLNNFGYTTYRGS